MNLPSAPIGRSGALAVLVAALFQTGTALADLKAGVAAYRSGDYATALREFSELAETGDAHAEFNLAILYLTGRGVEKDIARSVELHLKAAAKGLPAAAHGLGVFYYQGLGVKKDYQKALVWFRKSAAQGFADSEFNIGVMYFNRQGVARDDSEVVKWITLAASRKFAPAQYRLGQMYEKGVIFAKNPAEALHWYRLAEMQGDRNAPAAIARVVKSVKLGPLRSQTAPLNLASGAAAPAKEQASVPDADADKNAPAAVEDPEFAVTIPGKNVGSRKSGIPEPPQPAKTTAGRTENDIAGRGDAESGQPQSRSGAETRAPEKTSRPQIASRSGANQREWRVQFAAFRTAAEAEKAWTALAGSAADALGDLPRIVARADLGDRGVYHRLQAGPLESRAAAGALCARIRHVLPDQGCLPVRARAR